MSDLQKKPVTENDLERQYEDYRAQFEQWKENNKNSIGTAAYNAYVSQFEQWEKEVESRKTQQKKQRKNAPGTQNDEIEEAAAVAYAQSQEAYMTHHLKAMEQAEHHRAAQAAAQHHMINAMARRNPNEHVVHSDVFFRDVSNAQTTSSTGGSTSHQQMIAAPPTLWGNPKPAYDSRDPLFGKWGNRAATSHTKFEAEASLNPVACWMLLDTLREKKMVLAPHSNAVQHSINVSSSSII